MMNCCIHVCIFCFGILSVVLGYHIYTGIVVLCCSPPKKTVCWYAMMWSSLLHFVLVCPHTIEDCSLHHGNY